MFSLYLLDFTLDFTFFVHLFFFTIQLLKKFFIYFVIKHNNSKVVSLQNNLNSKLEEN